jgi:hypothetical protein
MNSADPGLLESAIAGIEGAPIACLNTSDQAAELTLAQTSPIAVCIAIVEAI